MLGDDTWFECDENYKLPKNMVEVLKSMGLYYLYLVDPIRTTIMSWDWYNARSMGFVGEEGQIWNNHCHALNGSHIRIKEDEDEK